MSLELSIPINIGQLGQRGRTIRQMVDKETCAGISSRLAVNAIEEFFIDIFIQKDSETKLTVTVDGSIKATVIQSCSVTLEPIISKLSIPQYKLIQSAEVFIRVSVLHFGSLENKIIGIFLVT